MRGSPSPSKEPTERIGDSSLHEGLIDYLSGKPVKMKPTTPVHHAQIEIYGVEILSIRLLGK